MCVNPRNSRHLQAIYQAPSTCRWLVCRAGPRNLPPAGNRLWWSVKPIGGPHGQQPSYSPRAFGMLPSFAAEQTSGIAKGSVSNSWDRELFWHNENLHPLTSSQLQDPPQCLRNGSSGDATVSLISDQTYLPGYTARFVRPTVKPAGTSIQLTLRRHGLPELG